VVEERTERAADVSEDSKLCREMAYLPKHGAAGRLKYPTFRGPGLARVSGAIKSNIRRLVNL
jgi:hypothetical protein